MLTTHERIAGFPLLAGLSRDHLDLLTSAATTVRYARRERLFWPDKPTVV